MSGYDMDFGEWVKKMPRKTTLGDYTRRRPSTSGIAVPGGRYGNRTVIEGRGGFMPNVERCTAGPAPTRPPALRAEDV